jgi:2-keto-4-pentenoate hydratase/2-oxohepta-3-ene-1,7-dioic acid hydratase in catechol pathway
MTAYRLVTYRDAGGAARAGLLTSEDRVREIASIPGCDGLRRMLDVLEAWDTVRPRLEAAAARTGEGLPLEQVQLLAPVPDPPAIYGAGANYRDHVAEMMAAQGKPMPPDPRERGEAPWHFLKASRSVTHPGADVRLPRSSAKVDWEVELAAVIGRAAKDVDVASALDHVAGYTIANDLSARDLGRRLTQPEASLFRADWIGQKSFDGACPLGPWLVPASAIADPMRLGMKLWVNGVLKQDSNTAEMIFGLAEQIAFLSSRMTLHPGDVILTGTPAGVGAGRGEFLQPGDEVDLWIEGIGRLINRMA